MAAELLLLSSRHEAGPLVVLEAGISGVPTVGTRVGHIAEWDPDAAVAVPPGDAPALAAAVSDLWLDDDRRMRLGREAQLHAIRDDADNCARLFLALYRRVRS
jgi:glycosyltransferase involved in cell wall biosynthesis